MQPVTGDVDKRCVAELHPRQITAAVSQPLHRGKVVGRGFIRQSVRIIVLCDVLPQQFIRLRGVNGLPLAAHPAFIIIAVVNGDAVAVAEMADFCQPALFVVVSAFGLFIIHGAVRQAVGFIVMPERDQALISLTVIWYTLHPPSGCEPRPRFLLGSVLL